MNRTIPSNQCPACGELAKFRSISGYDFVCSNPLCDVREFRPRSFLRPEQVEQSIDRALAKSPAHQAALQKETQ